MLFYQIGSLIIGCSEIIAGASVLLKATKLSPNTYLGFRVPVAFLTRNIWTKVNRVSGKIGVVLGLVSIIGSLLRNIFSYIIAFTTLAISISVPIIYARRIMEKETGRAPGPETPSQTLEVIRINRVSIVVSMMEFIAIIGILLASYESLPNRVAIHFNLAGEPDIFTPKLDFLVILLANVLLAVTILCSLFIAIDGIPNIPEFKDYNNRIRKIYSVMLVFVPAVLLIATVLTVSYNIAT